MQNQRIDLSVLARDHSVLNSSVPEPNSKWKTRVLLPAAIILAFAGALGYAAREALWPAKAVTIVPVVVKSTAGVSSSGVAFQAAGWIEPDPFPSYVSALTDGIVKEVLVLEGQPIKAGQVVARLIDDEARLGAARARAEHLQMEAEVRAAEAALKAAERQWENPFEQIKDVAVAEGALAETKAMQAQLESEIEVESARLLELEEQLRREDIASKANAIPEFQKIQTRLRMKTQQALLQVARSRKPALDAKIKQQEAELLAAQQDRKLRIKETKELEEARASLARAKAQFEKAVADCDMSELRLQRMEVRAPADGVVMARLTEPGAKLMMSGQEMNSARALRFYDPKKQQVRVDVPLAEAGRVTVGQDALIVVEVLRDQTFKGKVTRILHEADLQKNTLQVKVAIENPAPELKPEMLARVQFVSVSKTDSKEASAPVLRVFAPENLIHKDSNGAHAWIVDKGRRVATKRGVLLGSAKQDGWIEIARGLQAGDALIVAEDADLREGMKVKAAESSTEGGNKHGAH
ncbi:MAG TPA: efflux RND transporter periplasmic adaptor subunit [Planctomycetota bacterium]|nr:efflux RND transporter periplasmic adaptor subunit [Planctomycetota bacterium]